MLYICILSKLCRNSAVFAIIPPEYCACAHKVKHWKCDAWVYDFVELLKFCLEKYVKTNAGTIGFSVPVAFRKANN